MNALGECQWCCGQLTAGQGLALRDQLKRDPGDAAIPVLGRLHNVPDLEVQLRMHKRIGQNADIVTGVRRRGQRIDVLQSQLQVPRSSRLSDPLLPLFLVDDHNTHVFGL